MKLLLDTCTIIWTISDPKKLSPAVTDALLNPAAHICVSAISAGEIACAQNRNKIKLDRHWKKWFRFFIEENNWEVIPIDLEIIEEAYSLPDPFHKDPADRIIVATSRTHKMIAITADKKILEYPHVDTLW